MWPVVTAAGNASRHQGTPDWPAGAWLIAQRAEVVPVSGTRCRTPLTEDSRWPF